MIIKAGILWVVGLVLLVPYAAYYLLFEAPREQYALLITFLLFWIFGYWGVVAPLVMAMKARSVFKAIERAGSGPELEQVLRGEEAREVAIDFIATENHIPRFLARRVYGLLVTRLSQPGARR